MKRRKALAVLIGSSMAILTGLLARSKPQSNLPNHKMKSNDMKINVSELPKSGPWPTSDPFLFCVHHNDQYPAANENMGPNASLRGRNLGQDFDNKDGWNMYHGLEIPGFPQHPHRGFETLTVVKQGLIDHSDSLGAKARYGDGDAQWLTAGDGIVHAEMFPLLNQTDDNPMDFFQIWINLPAKHKRVDPHFSMFWDNQIPKVTTTDEKGLETEVTLVAGSYLSAKAPAPPPNSWAADSKSDLAVWVIKMAGGARWTLPAVEAGTERSVYVVSGDGVRVSGTIVPNHSRIQVLGGEDLEFESMEADTELLLLQGKPIAEPVARYGPFVMNTQTEIQEAFNDYRRTQFGGWKWPENGPVHGRDPKRFALLIDGSLDTPTF
jgi:redox-sensitive bicupin YhaK (pirin superfamily)